jgi:hypothetical protein|nr:MAG TPA: hypothetical protein [Caudoviricetes sp.]
MAAQLNYNYSTPKGVPGGKFDLVFDEVVTRTNEEEDSKMKYGLAVAVGANVGTGVKLPSTGITADKIEGVTVAIPTTEHDINGKVIVKKGASLGVMKRGNIWGRLATGVTPVYGKTAYVVVTGDDVGAFTTDSSNTVDIGAKFGNVADKDNGIAVILL